MKKIIICILLFSFAFSGDSKYDSAVSKYDVGIDSFRYKYDAGSTGCEELSLKEREAIMSDVKSGRFKIKKHPELKGLLYVSGNFSSDREYAYYGDLNTCVRHNKDSIIESLTNSRIPYQNGYRSY